MRTRILLYLALSAVLIVFLSWRGMHNNRAQIAYEPSDQQSIARHPVELLFGKEYVLQHCCNHSFQSTRIDGSEVAKFTITHKDPLVYNATRAETRFPSDYIGQVVAYTYHVKSDADWSTADLSPVVAAQWHGLADYFLGEQGAIPPLSFKIIGEKWQIDKAWNPAFLAHESDSQTAPKRKRLYEGDFTPGEWTAWTVIVKWSYGDDGFVKILRDNALVVDDRGPNTHNDLFGPYLKFGVYVPSWKKIVNDRASLPDRTLYFKDVRIMK